MKLSRRDLSSFGQAPQPQMAEADIKPKLRPCSELCASCGQVHIAPTTGGRNIVQEPTSAVHDHKNFSGPPVFCQVGLNS